MTPVEDWCLYGMTHDEFIDSGGCVSNTGVKLYVETEEEEDEEDSDFEDEDSDLGIDEEYEIPNEDIGETDDEDEEDIVPEEWEDSE